MTKLDWGKDRRRPIAPEPVARAAPRARYPGICPTCLGPIRRGDPLTFLPVGDWSQAAHASCHEPRPFRRPVPERPWQTG